MNKVLLLSDQPFQTNFQIDLAQRLVESGVDCRIATVDTYLFLYNPGLIERAKKATNRPVHTLEHCFRHWQAKGEPEMEGVEDFLTSWELQNCRRRSLAELERTNNTLFADERSDYMLSVSESWRKRILYDSILWCEQVLDETKPDLIFSVDHCTLPTNLLYEKSLSLGVPFMTLQNTRIQNRWVIREDFFLGMDSKTLLEAQNCLLDEDSRKEAEGYLAQYKASSKSTYYALAHSQSMLSPRVKNLDKLGFHFRKLLLGVLDAFFRITTKRPVTYRIRRLEQQFTKLSLWELRGLLRIALYDLGHGDFGLKEPPAQTYMFWALHFRPEGSVLVLGKGKDEIATLRQHASKLPEGCYLLVKEHPLMFGYRSKGFYKDLASIPNVRLVDPFADSKKFLESSAGAIGMSGTILLEARLLGIPAWSFGEPEFLPFLSGNGEQDFSEFVEQVAKGTWSDKSENILAYLSFVFKNSSKDDSAINELLRPYELANLAGDLGRVSSKIIERLQEVS